MTSELKADGRRKRFHQRSKSSIGDYNLPIYLDPNSNVVQMKEPPNAGKKDHNRSWFKSKTPSKANPDVASDLEVEDEKPLQQHRVVQGLYRDDDGGPSPKTLVTSHSAAREAMKEFAKDFVAQMNAGDPDETLALESQMRQLLHLPSSSPTVPSKFVAQAYIVHHLFSDFENASFGIPNPGEKPWEVQDHMHRCFAQFQKCRTKSQTISTLLETESKDSSELSFLSQFCVQKFRKIVPSEAFFGGDCRHHLELEQGHHPDTPFYRSFLSAAVSVWLLQRLACSFEQKIVPIVPTRGDAFQRRFMAPVVPGVGDAEGEENDGNLEIAFTVFPGFRVSESVVESLVYIVEIPTALPKTEIPISTSVTEPPMEKIQKSLVGREHTLPPGSLVYTVESPTELPRDMSTSSFVLEHRVETTQKSHKGGEHSLLQKIRSKFIRKKTLVKGTVLAGNTATTTAAPVWNEQVSPRGEAAPRLKESAPSIEESAPRLEESAPSTGEAAPRLEESAPSIGETAPRLEEPTPSRGEVAPTLEESAPSREEAAPSELESPPPQVDNAEQNTTLVTNPASELSSPRFQTPNLGGRDSHVPPPNPYSSGGDDDKPLYTPRARKPLQSPRLSSVD